MTPPKAKPTPDLPAKFKDVQANVANSLAERNVEVELMVQCLLARTHILFLGDPGTAKSMTVRGLHDHVEGSIFERLVFKSSPAEEILGPISLRALEQDSYERVTKGKLPEANIAFIDEVFKANATILNAMLSIINERVFHNNGGVVQVPLWTAAFASNELPGLDRDDLRAFRDRIAVTRIVQDVRDEGSFRKIILDQAGRRANPQPVTPAAKITLAEVERAHAEVDAVKIGDEFLDSIVKMRRLCLDNNLRINPRRFGEGVRLAQAAAWLQGRDETSVDDLRVFEHIIWRDPDDQATAHRIMLDFASEFERKAARYTDEFEPIKADMAELRAGGVDPNDQEKLSNAIRIQRLLGVLIQKITETQEEARKEGRDSATLDDLANQVREDQKWIKKEAFGLDS